jgi:hypothetical protein
MAKKSKMMSAGEAIDHIMKNTGCSRRSARRQLAKRMHDGSLRYKKTAIDDPPLDVETAARAFKDDPSSVVTSLAELHRSFGFSFDDLQAELRSGRLVAAPRNENVLIQHEINRLAGNATVDPNDYVVAMDDFLQWATNPDTPPHLLAKFRREVQ